ncbi:DUF1330 domain-containing protein [Aquirhabdus parva]|uniref:DUF1330 domain-containing protein n=1 Tax=Aquirhabdus parva TaxID=2283318 RepID=A0A345P917_9GAMM|nr:DUF1330 domain-containing protein [Aquirhabdus parva]AXI03776.1 DUF1330 domain-containing protein [Aquirhabdus parva]
MAAYVIFIREKIIDAEKLAEYRQSVGSTFKDHPVKLIAANGPQKTLEGESVDDILILEFPSYEAASNWYNSPAYQEASKTRLQGASFQVYITEGFAAK